MVVVAAAAVVVGKSLEGTQLVGSSDGRMGSRQLRRGE